MLCMGRARLSAAPPFVVGACVLAAGLLLLTSRWQTVQIAPPAVPIVAVCISGAARGPVSLRASVQALRTYLIEPAKRSHDARVHVFGWLQDDATETTLETLLHDEPVVITRRMVRKLLPPGLALAEGAALRADHGWLTGSGRVAATTSPGVNFTNTLRMLRKIRGCEWLRQHQQSLSALPHTLVVRIRPDLMLLEPLPLPLPLDNEPLHGQAWGWHCAAQGVATDQLLVGEPGLAQRLGELYAADALRAAIARSQPPSAYPERLVWQHLALHRVELHPLPCRTALVGDGSGARPPHAKLARDFPAAGCPYPAPSEVQASVRLAAERLWASK